MSIAVVIIATRYQKQPGACLEAVVGQSRPPDEVIVVARSDDARAVGALRRWYSSCETKIPVRIVAVQAASLPEMLNAGTRLAVSSLVAFTFNFCIPDGRWLETLIQGFTDPLTGAVGGPILTTEDAAVIGASDAWGSISWLGRRIDHEDRVPTRPIFVDSLSRFNMAFRRYLLRDFDTRFRADLEREEDMCLAVKSMGFRVSYDPAARVFEPVTITAARKDLEASASGDACSHDGVYVFLKHASLPRRLAFIPYSFLVGDGVYPGMLSLLRRCRRRGKNCRRPAIGRVLRGKASGVASYLSYLRTRSKPYRY